MKSIRFLLAVAVAVCSALAYADPPARVGRLSLVSGPVSFAPADAPDQWVLAPVNRPLTSGDRLWTGEGRAALHFGPIAVRLDAYTAFDLLYVDDDAIQLRLAEGVLNVRVRELDADDTIEIATPGAAVLITQAGSYRVSVNAESDVTRVVVNFGRAEVVTPYSRYTVPSSQAAVLAGGHAPAFEVVTHTAADEFDRWSAELDRREDRPVATRYVSPHMTGYQDLDHYGTWSTEPEYGAVWFPTRVSAGWAPYRYGHWAWISPWGWTWIDDAPWGFAPFHYGRWVVVGGAWGWAPGPIVRRPVYAPALVAFIGGSGWSVSISTGPAVGWFPLGWREPFIPWYRTSPRYVQVVNVTHVTNITHIHRTDIRHVHRQRPEAVTVVPRQAFVSARPAGEARFTRVGRVELERAEIVRERIAEPTRSSLASGRGGERPPARVQSREVIAVNPVRPPAARESAFAERGGAFTREASEPPVRVIGRSQDDQRRRTERTAPPAAQPGGDAGAAAREAPRARSERGAVLPTPATQPRAAPAPSPRFERRESDGTRELARPQHMQVPQQVPQPDSARGATGRPGTDTRAVPPARGSAGERGGRPREINR
jgi:hypothetical protein